MKIENPQEQLFENALLKARREDSWFDVAAMSPFFVFELSSEEAEKVRKAGQVLGHLSALLNSSDFSDGQITSDKAIKYIRVAGDKLKQVSQTGNKKELEQIEQSVIALSRIFGIIDSSSGVGNVLQNIADNNDRSKIVIDEYIAKLKNSKLPEIYTKGLEFIRSKKM